MPFRSGMIDSHTVKSPHTQRKRQQFQVAALQKNTHLNKSIKGVMLGLRVYFFLIGGSEK